jgi:hypothetical protein
MCQGKEHMLLGFHTYSSYPHSVGRATVELTGWVVEHI